MSYGATELGAGGVAGIVVKWIPIATQLGEGLNRFLVNFRFKFATCLKV